MALSSQDEDRVDAVARVLSHGSGCNHTGTSRATRITSTDALSVQEYPLERINPAKRVAVHGIPYSGSRHT